jgi:hypothetical protein
MVFPTCGVHRAWTTRVELHAKISVRLTEWNKNKETGEFEP